jgi:hypothetical protein
VTDEPFVRVKDNATKHELTIRRERLDDPDVKAGVTVLSDKPAVDAGGAPLSPTYYVPKGSKPAPSAVAKEA